MRAPFPWFGGKSAAADIVWSAFGDVPHYVEPFAGSLAVLLARPTAPRLETVCDRDGWIANFWRALKAEPDAVAAWADWPSTEVDYNARVAFFRSEAASVNDALECDPEWYDVRLAGWWVWGQSTGILGNWPKTRGFHHGPPCGIHSTTRRFAEDAVILAARLRNVRVMCGDFVRCLRSLPDRMAPHAVLLDPPYSNALRAGGCYLRDSDEPAARAREWAIAHGSNRNMRIALCGYDGEHDMPSTWRCVEWKAPGGMDRVALGGRGEANRARERIWLSPHCLREQRGIFDTAAGAR